MDYEKAVCLLNDVKKRLTSAYEIEAISYAINIVQTQVPDRVFSFIVPVFADKECHSSIGVHFCPKCYSVVTNQSNFCQQCGKRLEWSMCEEPARTPIHQGQYSCENGREKDR